MASGQSCARCITAPAHANRSTTISPGFATKRKRNTGSGSSVGGNQERAKRVKVPISSQPAQLATPMRRKLRSRAKKRKNVLAMGFFYAADPNSKDHNQALRDTIRLQALERHGYRCFSVDDFHDASNSFEQRHVQASWDTHRFREAIFEAFASSFDVVVMDYFYLPGNSYLKRYLPEGLIRDNIPFLANVCGVTSFFLPNDAKGRMVKLLAKFDKTLQDANLVWEFIPRARAHDNPLFAATEDVERELRQLPNPRYNANMYQYVNAEEPFVHIYRDTKKKPRKTPAPARDVPPRKKAPKASSRVLVQTNDDKPSDEEDVKMVDSTATPATSPSHSTASASCSASPSSGSDDERTSVVPAMPMELNQHDDYHIPAASLPAPVDEPAQLIASATAAAQTSLTSVKPIRHSARQSTLNLTQPPQQPFPVGPGLSAPATAPPLANPAHNLFALQALGGAFPMDYLLACSSVQVPVSTLVDTHVGPRWFTSSVPLSLVTPAPPSMCPAPWGTTTVHNLLPPQDPSVFLNSMMFNAMLGQQFAYPLASK